MISSPLIHDVATVWVTLFKVFCCWGPKNTGPNPDHLLILSMVGALFPVRIFYFVGGRPQDKTGCTLGFCPNQNYFFNKQSSSSTFRGVQHNPRMFLSCCEILCWLIRYIFLLQPFRTLKPRLSRQRRTVQPLASIRGLLAAVPEIDGPHNKLSVGIQTAFATLCQKCILHSLGPGLN